MSKKGKGGGKRSKAGGDIVGNASNPGQTLISLLQGGPTVAGIAVGPDRAMTNATVNACIRILSEDTAKISIAMYQGTERGRTRREVTMHPAIQVLSQVPNDWMSPFDYWRFHQMNYLLAGNHYDFQLRDNRGDLLELIPIPEGRVTIYIASDGELFYGVSRGNTHEQSVLAGQPLMIPAQYMLHDRGPSRDGIHGLSVIGWQRETIGLALAGEDHASRTFSQGARPSGVLQHPKTMSDPARDRVRADFESYRGQAGAMKTILLEEGLVFNPIAMSNVDVQFIESRRFQVEEIARMFGVPHHKLGVPDPGRNLIDALEQNYINTTLMNHLERIESLLNTRLLTSEERGKYYFEFDLSRILRGDLPSRYNAYAVARQWGWLSVNDILAAENLNPVPNGDERLQPVNMVPLGTPPAPQPSAAGGSDSAPGTTAPGTQPPGASGPPTPPAAGTTGTGKGNGHTTWP